MQHHLPIERNLKGFVSGMSLQPLMPEERLLAKQATLDAARHGHPRFAISSSLPRCLDTAGLWLDGTGIPILVDDRVTALDYGVHHDKKSVWVNERLHKFVETPFPDGESLAEMAGRFNEFLVELSIRHKDDAFDIVMIGHAGTQAVLLHLTRGFSLVEALNIESCVKRRIRHLRDRGFDWQRAVDCAYQNSPLRGPFPIPATGSLFTLEGRIEDMPTLGTYSIMARRR